MIKTNAFSITENYENPKTFAIDRYLRIVPMEIKTAEKQQDRAEERTFSAFVILFNGVMYFVEPCSLWATFIPSYGNDTALTTLLRCFIAFALALGFLEKSFCFNER